MFKRYLETGKLPPYLDDLRGDIEQGREAINAAYAEHTQQVRDHAVWNGYRQFTVSTPSALRQALPLAMHLVEQAPAAAEDVLGAYSLTRGSVYTCQPGLFLPATHPRAGAQTRQELWRITPSGDMRRAR